MSALRVARHTPRDLRLVVALTLLADACVLASPAGGTLRILLGLALALVAPGYAVVAALFPDGETGATRLALAVAVSAVLTPLVGLALSLTPFGLRAAPIAGVLTVVTCLAVVIAAWRRSARDAIHSDFDATRSETGTDASIGDGRSWAALDVALVALTLLAVMSVGYAALTPDTGGTSLSLTTTDADGQRVAGDYPGGNGTVSLGVTNHGVTATTYTVVVQRQRVDATNATRVLARDEIRRATLTVEAGATRYRPSSVADGPGRTRVVYLLYEETVPLTPTTANADYEVHRWLN